MRKAALTCAISALIVLAGCGGGGGSSSTGGGDVNLWEPGLIHAKVDLSWATRGRATGEPAFVRTLIGLGDIEPDGSFTVVALPNSPALATIEDADGDVLGYAYIDKTTTKIDDKLCASTLAFLSMKAGALPADGRLQFWKELQEQPEIDTLAADLSALYSSGTPDPEAIRQAVSNDLQPLIERANGATRGIGIDPSSGKSGIEVLQQGLAQIYIKNHYRRRAHAFVQRVEVVLENGDVEPRSDEVTNFPVDPITNPNSINAAVGDAGTILGNYFSGSNELFTSNVAWVPTTTSPLTLDVLPANARATKYRVVVVGPGRFSNPPSPLTPEMTAKFDDLLLQTAMIDVVIPAFFIAAGPMLDRFEDSGRISEFEKQMTEYVLVAAKDIIGGIIAAPAIHAKFEEGDYVGGFGDALSALVQSDAFNTIIREAVMAALQPLIQSVLNNPNFEPEQAIADLEENAGRFLTNLRNLMASADLLLQAADYAMILGHIGASQAYEEFFVTVTKARVILTPPNGHLSVGDSLRLTASVPDATGDEAPLLQYHWKLLSGEGVQLQSGTNVGTDFTTSTPEVDLVSINHQTGTAQVQVEAIIVQPGENESLGTATSQVNVVDDRVLLTPARSSIQPSGTQALVARVNNADPNVHYLFKWSLTGGSGAIDEGPELTARTSVTYSAGQSEGYGEVTVEAYENGPSGLVRLGSSSARVLVETEPTILPASYSAFSASADGRGRVVALVKCPRVEGATSYRLVGTGGYDFAYFGDSINFTMSPFTDEPQWGLVEPENEFWVGLSGWDGPEGGIGGAVAWMNARFSGFSFYVEITR